MHIQSSSKPEFKKNPENPGIKQQEIPIEAVNIDKIVPFPRVKHRHLKANSSRIQRNFPIFGLRLAVNLSHRERAQGTREPTLAQKGARVRDAYIELEDEVG